MSIAPIVLVTAIVILGGVIATVGDRLGSRVGKARLSLFNLRPRQTAVLITILTGLTISASTLGVLFASSKELRDGVFKLAKIKQELRHSGQDLERLQARQQGMIRQLERSRTEELIAQKALRTTNLSLSQARQQQRVTATVLAKTLRQFSLVARQTLALHQEIHRLKQEQLSLVQQRNQVRSEIAQRDQALAAREAHLVALQHQQARLESQIVQVEHEYDLVSQGYQDLLQGNIAVQRGQLLSAGVLKITSPQEAPLAIDQILQVANAKALQLVRPGTSTVGEQIIQIPQQEVEHLIQVISDGRDYVVSIHSLGNYIVGAKEVQVGAEVSLNQLVFSQGALIASTTIDASQTSPDQVLKKLNLLFAYSQFRARQGGLLTDTVQIDTNVLANFIKQVQQYQGRLQIQAVAAKPTYTIGPLQISLVALHNGQVVFRSQATASDSL